MVIFRSEKIVLIDAITVLNNVPWNLLIIDNLALIYAFLLFVKINRENLSEILCAMRLKAPQPRAKVKGSPNGIANSFIADAQSNAAPIVFPPGRRLPGVPPPAP
jgi:hypothetical protein